MRKLILIKHASPLIDPAKPAHEWKLSERGREAAGRLATRLAEHQLDVIVTSKEPKAVETGQIVANALGKPCKSEPGLEEHDRSNVPVMATREFISYIAHFFKNPDELVLGKETADDARERIEDAIHHVLDEHPDQNVAIVTHGTVLALFAAPLLKVDTFVLWRRQGSPSYVVFDLPEMRATTVVDAIE